MFTHGDLPEYIDVDLANVNVGEAVHLSDIVLPEGVEIYALQHGGDSSATVASVNVPKVSVDDVEEQEEEQEELQEELQEEVEEE